MIREHHAALMRELSKQQEMLYSLQCWSQDRIDPEPFTEPQTLKHPKPSPEPETLNRSDLRFVVSNADCRVHNSGFQTCVLVPWMRITPKA